MREEDGESGAGARNALEFGRRNAALNREKLQHAPDGGRTVGSGAAGGVENRAAAMAKSFSRIGWRGARKERSGSSRKAPMDRGLAFGMKQDCPEMVSG